MPGLLMCHHNWKARKLRVLISSRNTERYPRCRASDWLTSIFEDEHRRAVSIKIQRNESHVNGAGYMAKSMTEAVPFLCVVGGSRKLNGCLPPCIPCDPGDKDSPISGFCGTSFSSTVRFALTTNASEDQLFSGALGPDLLHDCFTPARFYLDFYVPRPPQQSVCSHWTKWKTKEKCCIWRVSTKYLAHLKIHNDKDVELKQMIFCKILWNTRSFRFHITISIHLPLSLKTTQKRFCMLCRTFRSWSTGMFCTSDVILGFSWLKQVQLVL